MKALTVTALAATSLSSYASAVTDKAFDIPAQSLASALSAYAAQSGRVVTVPPELVKDRLSPAVSGRMSEEEALRLLLQRTGLSVHINPKGSVTIVRAPKVAFAAAAAAAEAEAQVVPVATEAATPSAQEDSSLEEVTVTGKIVFTQNDAFGATKMGLPVAETPQTVNIVTSDLIDVAGMRNFTDFYKVDASTGTSHVLDGYPRTYYRGFREQGNLGGNNAVRVDGFRMSGNIDLDLSIFDRFEVVKGTTSTLYGQNSVGGMLNAVSKLPQKRFGLGVDLEGGQFDDYRVDADITGPLFGSDAWAFRVLTAFEEAGSYVDYINNDRKLISPSIEYSPSDATRIILRATYQKDDSRYHWAPILQLAGDGGNPDDEVLTRVLDVGLKLADLPRSRYFAMPWNGDARDVLFLQFQGEHRFANGWTVRTHAQRSHLNQSTHNFYIQGPFDQDGFAYFSSAYGVDADSKLYAGEVNLFGDVELFGRRHTVFFGVDGSKLRNHQRLSFGGISSGYADSVFNAFNPDYTAVPPHASVDEQFTYIYQDDDETALFGGTVQLIMRPTERLNLILGGRQTHDKFTNRSRGGAIPPQEVSSLDYSKDVSVFKKFVMQSGVSYKLTDRFHAYASYGETFEAQFGNVFDADVPGGRPLQPEDGTTAEIGLKGDLAPQLFFTAALFDMKRSNISEGDPDHPAFSLNVGTQRSRGMELGLQGKLLPPLSVNVSVAYLDAEFIAGEAKGGRPPNAPRFGASAYATYEVLQGRAQGLGFGAGIVHKQGLKGFDYGWTADAGHPVTFDFGSFTEVDARVFYNRERWSFALSGTNLFDELYYSQDRSSLTLGTHVNPPRAVRLKVGYRY